MYVLYLREIDWDNDGMKRDAHVDQRLPIVMAVQFPIDKGV
jgi:hypothetical protein